MDEGLLVFEGGDDASGSAAKLAGGWHLPLDDLLKTKGLQQKRRNKCGVSGRRK
jgi:hypothetical protein